MISSTRSPSKGCNSSYKIFSFQDLYELINNSAARGSKCLPGCSWIYSSAFFLVHALRYGRSLVKVSYTSTTANSRTASGISSPFRPRGYPLPSSNFTDRTTSKGTTLHVATRYYFDNSIPSRNSTSVKFGRSREWSIILAISDTVSTFTMDFS